MIAVARGRAPVAKTDVHEPLIVDSCSDVVYVAENSRRVFSGDRQVAAVEPRVIRQIDENDVPSGSVAPREAPAGGRDDARDSALVVHRLLDVVHPLAPVALRCQRHHHLLRRERRVAGPAVLFAVRAVGREVIEVREVGDDSRVPELVRHLIRASEVRTRLEACVHDDIGQKIACRLGLVDADDQHVLEAVVGEARHVGLVAAFTDVNVAVIIPVRQEWHSAQVETAVGR